ncbi:hypothetical protein VNO78_23139 [Psophocarpus tetragonolobus]|uniref:Uncharacterized protein n=1 Tax=Psophocarpus tetragonolobus TaxID=3891 RepID=A0AAN9S3Y4_PSOTE
MKTLSRENSPPRGQRIASGDGVGGWGDEHMDGLNYGNTFGELVQGAEVVVLVSDEGEKVVLGGGISPYRGF